MIKKILSVCIALFLFTFICGPVEAGSNSKEDAKSEVQEYDNPEVSEAVAAFKQKDPGMNVFFKKAYGYAVFPTIGKGGLGIGGAYGKGEVYSQGKFIGTASMKQITIGFQLGGQAFSEIIFFRDKKALDDFTVGKFKLGAQVSAVAATAGASAGSDYVEGIVVFTLAKGGLMYEASVGGQKFSFQAK